VSASAQKGGPPTFILVHGTWAKRAVWTTGKGALVRRLEAEFPGCSVRPLIWSGRNKFDDRIAAGYELRQTLAGVSDLDAPLFLIGHSHGGSVITYALRESQGLLFRVTGAIFLGTPFMSLAVRGATASVYRAVVIISVVAALLPTSFARGYFAESHPWSDDNAVRDYTALGLVGVLLTLAVWLGVRGMRSTAAIRRRSERVRSWCDQFATSNFPAVQAIFMRTTGDEVALVMGFLQLLSYVSNTAGAVAAWSLQQVARFIGYLALRSWGKMLLTVLAIVLALAMTLSGLVVRMFGSMASNLFDIINPFSEGWSVGITGIHSVDFVLAILYRSSLGVIDATLVLVAVLAVAVLLLLLLALVASTLTLYVFGRMDPGAALWLDLAADPVPYGTHTLVHLPWERRAHKWTGALDFRLRHSEPYSDPIALQMLCDWIRRRIAE
jgi:hypothetical protein